MEVKTLFLQNKILYLKKEQLTFDKFPIRDKIDEESIISLAANIKKNGLLVPLAVRKNIDDKNKFNIVSGYRRYLALCFLGAEKFPCTVYSLTDSESYLIKLLLNDTPVKLDYFEISDALKILLKEKNYSECELCELLNISQSKLNLMLLPSVFEKSERKFLKDNNFSLNFITKLAKQNDKKRKIIINKIIAEQLDEKNSLKIIDDEQKPKPQKIACLKSDTIILNSVHRLAENLKNSGIDAKTEKKETENCTEYIIKVKKSVNQMTFDFTVKQ